IGSQAQLLLKQTTSLTCGAATLDQIQQMVPPCDTFTLVSQGMTPDAAFAQLVQLELVRLLYQPGWTDLSDWAGLPKSETAVLWGFPVHSASVAEVDPKVGIVPQMPTLSEIHVGVNGLVDPQTVKAYSRTDFGPIVVTDLTAIAAMDLGNGFPS